MAPALFYARRALALDWPKAAVTLLLPFCPIIALAALITALPALVTILAEAIMAALFGKPVDEAAKEGAAAGYVLWQAVFYLALAPSPPCWSPTPYCSTATVARRGPKAGGGDSPGTESHARPIAVWGAERGLFPICRFTGAAAPSFRERTWLFTGESRLVILAP